VPALIVIRFVVIIPLSTCRPFFNCLVSSTSQSKVSLINENEADLDGRKRGAFCFEGLRQKLHGGHSKNCQLLYWATMEHRTFQNNDHYWT